MTIRPATNLDVPRMLEMGINFHNHTRYARLINLDPASTAMTAHHLVNTDGCVVLVAECVVPRDPTLNGSSPVDTILVGMLGLATYVHPLSGELVAGELFWWVEPDYRGSTGLRLLQEAERWATERGAKKLVMIAPNDGIESLYRRLGFDKVEVNYWKDM